MDTFYSTRRAFLKTSCLAGAAALVPGCESGGKRDSVTADPYVETRKRAARKKRRIIMNNDGNDYNNASPDEPKTPETFLAKRTTPLLGSHVDTIFYCTGVFNYYSHRSEVSELLKSDEAASRHVHELMKYGTDSLEVMTGFCHEHSLEIFWSMRMNDNHDSTIPYLLCQWKKDNPDYLIGREGDRYPYVNDKWSMVDYGVPYVREHVFSILEDVATRYDVDGIEYDFFRHPAFFKPQFIGEPVTQYFCDMMTDLLARVREMTEDVGRKRGRPMLIAVRIPDSVAYAKAIGLDVVRWLEDDLIDIVTGGGYFHLEPWENLVALGKEHDVPVYACFVSRRVMGGGEPEAGTDIKLWRGEALRAWKAGVDGIYTFNRFDPSDQLFRELGDPALLETLDHIDQENFAGESGYLDPGYWLRDGRSYIRS